MRSRAARDASSARQATAHEAAACTVRPHADHGGRRAMPLLAETFFQSHENELTAALSLLVAGALIFFVDRVIKRSARQVRSRAGARRTRSGHQTRGCGSSAGSSRRPSQSSASRIALSQFAALDRLATSLLASGALAAAIVGFAARQTLANAVAGVLLFVTQPLRIGDLVTFEGETGTVEDVRLTYTWLRDGRRRARDRARTSAWPPASSATTRSSTPRSSPRSRSGCRRTPTPTRAVGLLDGARRRGARCAWPRWTPRAGSALTVTGTAQAAHDRARREARAARRVPARCCAPRACSPRHLPDATPARAGLRATGTNRGPKLHSNAGRLAPLARHPCPLVATG